MSALSRLTLMLRGDRRALPESASLPSSSPAVSSPRRAEMRRLRREVAAASAGIARARSADEAEICGFAVRKALERLRELREDERMGREFEAEVRRRPGGYWTPHDI